MEQKYNIQQFKDQTRLPKFAIPSHYDLHLKPDLMACSFSGTVNISLSIIEPTRFIVLNALELNIHEVVFKFPDNQYSPDDIILDCDDEILVLVFHETLVGDGVLEIQFSGILNEHLRGFYKCTYMDGEEKKNMAVTQFEAVDARRCFPCWDEPALKATFKLTVDVPLELTALSNMPIIDEHYNGNIKTVYFEESPLMSTYLVAIVIGLFNHIEDTTSNGIKVGVYCPVGKSDKGKYALSIAVKALDLYTEYFSMPYPLPKLDMVAVPEFAGGAMENYGLIIYREIDLLHDDLQSTANRKQRLTIVVLHEVAHQWFGNLVTMEWWTHLWLNEGFATWISYMATDKLFPEWNIWTQFLRITSSGLRIDALEGSHPIEVEIPHARSVGEIFDDISYKKGSAVIRMLQGYLGDDIIKKSLRSYIKKHSWRNATTEDLWNILSEESSVEVNSMMNSWTKQKGYPVISVELKDNFLEFKQSQFISSGYPGDGKWVVPVTLVLGSYNISKNFLLQTEVVRVDIADLVSSLNEHDKPTWIKVNIEQSGFYRVKYDEELSASLKEAVERNSLSAADKFGILDDAFALCGACEIPLSSLLSLMAVYKKEIDYVVVSQLIEICYNILEISIDAFTESVNDLKAFFINLLLFSAEKLGWEPKSGESHLNSLLRREVYNALATFGHHKTHVEAMSRFQALINDKNTSLLSVDTRKAAYIAVMRNASMTNRSGFEYLLKIYDEADTVQEKERILGCLASSPDPELVKEALNFLVSDKVRDQDIIYGLPGISLEGREIAWKWLKENWDRILSKYGAALLITHFIRDIISPFCSNEKAEEVEEFFASHLDPTFAMNLKQSIEKVKIKARWIHHINQQIFLHKLIKQHASTSMLSSASYSH